MKPHLERGKLLRKNILLVQTKCNFSCDYMKQIQILKDRVTESEEYLSKIINSLDKTDVSRTKRAILSSIATIHEILYGTLDESDEKFLVDILQEAKNDTSQLAKLIARQTEIITSNVLVATEKFANTEKLLSYLFSHQQNE